VPTKRRPKSSWKESSSRRAFFESLACSKGFAAPTDWYRLTKRDVIDGGGSGLLRHYYGGSVSVAIQHLFPEHHWHQWRFSRSPRNLWNEPTKVRDFLDSLAPKLNVSNLNDWYRVAAEELVECGGETLLTKFGSLQGALQQAYDRLQTTFDRVPR
jgi:hypothetical protein